MSTMTLEQVRDRLRAAGTKLDGLMADAIDAHLRREVKVPDVSADVAYAWQRIAKVSGSALLAGEKKAQTSEQRALVYGEACQALVTMGNVYFDLTGKHPSDEAAATTTTDTDGDAHG